MVISSPSVFLVLYVWKSTVWEKLLLVWPAMGQSAICPHLNDGQARQLSDVEVSLSNEDILFL